MKKLTSLILILILLFSIGLSAYAVSFDMTVGVDIGSKGIFTISPGEKIESVIPPSGLPSGLFIEVGSDTIFLRGTPTTAGSYYFILTVNVLDSNNVVTERNIEVGGIISNSPVVSPTPTATQSPSSALTIVKHPGAENRTVGGTAIFIVKASGATNVSWTLIGPDGGQYSLDAFKAKFPGLNIATENKTTDGILSSTIYISNLTMDVSGYSAFATFTNDQGQTANTSSAGIKVTAATPSPTVTPVSTPSPVPTATPIPTTAPTTAPTQLPVETIAPIVSTDEDVISHRGTGGGTIFVTILVGLMTIAIATVLILYVLGKINLSWLENLLESKSKRFSKKDDSDSSDNNNNKV